MIPPISPEPPPEEKGVNVLHLMNHSAGYKRGDLVFAPVDKKVFKGKVLGTLWKSNGEWVVVEVEYTDLGGKTHKATLKPMRPDKLTRREG